MEEKNLETTPLTLNDTEEQEQPVAEEQPKEEPVAEKPEPQEPSFDERYQALESNYKRLERKFTKTSQELSENKRLADSLRWIQERPDLAEQVQMLINTYSGQPAAPQQQVDYIEMRKQEVDSMRYLMGRQDFVANEQAIRDFAEDEGFDPDSFAHLKQAYRLWRGENADKIAQQEALKLQQRGQQKQQARAKSGLQGTGGPTNSTPPDYRKMSPQEVLASLGLKLYNDE